VKILVAFLLWICAATAWATCPATYNFPGSGALNAADWTQVATLGRPVSALQEGSSTTFPLTAATEGAAEWVGASCAPGSDHFSEGVSNTAITGATGLLVRFDPTTGNGYLLLLQSGGSGLILKLTGLAGTVLTSCPAYTLGQTAHFEAFGSTLTVFYNGAAVCQTSDTSYTTGGAGILVDRFSGTTDTLSNFKVGVAPPPPLPIPVAAYATAAFVGNQDNITNNYPTMSAFLPQAEAIKFSPSNFGNVFFTGAPPDPVCYRLDGFAPTATVAGTCDSPAVTYTYGVTGNLNITGSVTMKIIGTAVGATNSGVGTYPLTVAPFYPTPATTGVNTGTYSYSPLLITLTGDMGSNLIYTTNGSPPTVSGNCTSPTNGTAAANGVQLTAPNSATTTYKFAACSGAGILGTVQTGIYTQQARTTWIVDTTAHGGGTRFSANVPTGQCNGKSTAHYVSGTNQPCPFNDIRYLWDDGSGVVGQGEWVVAGGDIISLNGCTALGGQTNPSNPNCRIGWDNPNTQGQWCNGVGANLCTNPTIPSGSSAQPTAFQGTNFASLPTGGTNDPKNYASSLVQIFGGFGLFNVLNLASTQNVSFSGIELTTHNGVCTDFGFPAYPAGCSRSAPFSDYAHNGYLMDRYSAGITFQDVYIHGLNLSGIQGPFGKGIVMTRVNTGFNAFAAWNMDDGFTTPDGAGASVAANHIFMKGNGCYEEYPIVHAWPAQSCYDTNVNGFGDSWSGQDTFIDFFTCNDCNQIYNTKDGWYGPHVIANNMTITNGSSIGNMGQQLKWGPAVNTLVQNELLMSNCRRQDEILPGAPQNFAAIFISSAVITGGNTITFQTPGGQHFAAGDTVWFWNFNSTLMSLNATGGTVLSAGLSTTQFEMTVGGLSNGSYTDVGDTQSTNAGRGGGSYLAGFCRASGDGITVTVGATSVVNFIGNTYIALSNTGFDYACGSGYFLNQGNCGGSTVNNTDNIFLGFQDPTNGTGVPPALFFKTDTTVPLTNSFNNEFGIRNGDCPGGTSNQCLDPLLLNEPAQIWPGTETDFDVFSTTIPGSSFNLTPSSPGKFTGTNVTGFITDHTGATRPSPPSMGALEPLGTPTLSTITVLPNPASVTTGSTVAMAPASFCTFSDSSTSPVGGSGCGVTWTDINAHTSVNSSTGVVTGVSVGADTITATISTIFGTATVNVTAPSFVIHNKTLGAGKSLGSSVNF
jgi:hypothetical protein